MWSKLVEFIKSVVPGLIKKYLVQLVLNAIGIAGGVWTWIVGTFLSLLWSKKIEPALEEAAHLGDQKIVDKHTLDKYKSDIKGGADENTLVKDENSLLNSGRH